MGADRQPRDAADGLGGDADTLGVLFGLAIADFFAASDMSDGPAPGEPGFADWVDEEMNCGPTKGWMFFLGLPPYYRRGETRWICSAKAEETKLRRLAKVMEACEQHRRR